MIAWEMRWPIEVYHWRHMYMHIREDRFVYKYEYTPESLPLAQAWCADM